MAVSEENCVSSLSPVTANVTPSLNVWPVSQAYAGITAQASAGNVAAVNMFFGLQAYYNSWLSYGTELTFNYSSQANYRKWFESCCNCAVASVSLNCNVSSSVNTGGAVATAAVVGGSYVLVLGSAPAVVTAAVVQTAAVVVSLLQ